MTSMSTKRLKAKWWGWLARRKARKGDYRSALIYRRRILSLFPQSSYAQSYVGSCYIGLEQYDEAIEAFDRALQIDPNSAYARAQLGCAFV